MYLGRYVLGDEGPPLTLQSLLADTATTPDSAPTADVHTEGGMLVVSKQLPPLDRFGVTGLFRYLLPLTSAFSVGRHTVRYTWIISGTTYTREELDTFEIVAGGSSDGMILSMAYMDRPDGNDFILYQTSMGTLGASRGPRV